MDQEPEALTVPAVPTVPVKKHRPDSSLVLTLSLVQDAIRQCMCEEKGKTLNATAFLAFLRGALAQQENEAQ